MDRSVPFLNVCISFVAFITALSLVVYMLASFIMGTYDVTLQILDTIFLKPAERQAIVGVLNVEFLHTIALLIILMKAYRILVEYMRYYHIDIKYMLEIGIIAPVLELLFNYQGYSDDMRYILLGMAVSFAFVYAFKHDVLINATAQSRLEMERWRAARRAPAEVPMSPIMDIPEEYDETVVEPAPVKRRAPRKIAAKKVPTKRVTKKVA